MMGKGKDGTGEGNLLEIAWDFSNINDVQLIWFN